MRQCKCGNQQFFAHQLCRHDVTVDEAGNFIQDNEIYDSEHPYGPFTCTKCGAVYEEIKDIPNPVKESYEGGVCPDCSERIPDDVEDGDCCANCEHVFYLPRPDDDDVSEDCSEGSDICYGCGSIFPANTLKDIDPNKFDIFCPVCKPKLYTKKEKREIMAMKKG